MRGTVMTSVYPPEGVHRPATRGQGAVDVYVTENLCKHVITITLQLKIEGKKRMHALMHVTQHIFLTFTTHVYSYVIVPAASRIETCSPVFDNFCPATNCPACTYR